MRDEIVVSLPARPEYLRIIRAVAASIAALLDFAYDRIEDLRIAIDEAGTQLLSVRPLGSTLTFRFLASSDAIEIVVSMNAVVTEWPPPGVEQSFSWQTLSVLADEATFERIADDPALRLKKRAR